MGHTDPPCIWNVAAQQWGNPLHPAARGSKHRAASPLLGGELNKTQQEGQRVLADGARG